MLRENSSHHNYCSHNIHTALFNGLCYFFPIVPALTVENIRVALRGIEEERWDDIGQWLRVPEETRREIRSQHSTDSERLRAVLLYTLTLHPRSSWRCVINALHRIEEHQVVERIQDYSEPVTSMHIKGIATIPCGVRLLSNDCHYKNCWVLWLTIIINMCVLGQPMIIASSKQPNNPH